MVIDTPLLIIGRSPAALVAAKVVSGSGLPSLIAGHEPGGDLRPVVLDDESLAILEPNGVLGVLRPYATAQDPFTIAPDQFEQGLKHHCVADMLITVYDGMAFESDRDGVDGVPIVGRLGDGRTSWEVSADAVLDVGTYPSELNGAIHRAAAFGRDLLSSIR